MKNVLFTALLLSLVLLVRAQEFKNKDLQSLVTVEVDFAKLAKEKNNRQAFLTYVNTSSLTLNEAIQSTKSYWERQPIDSMWLNWHPLFADVSVSGDIGYTHGSWSGHPTKNSGAQFGGQYVTVWKKQSDGAWKIAIDAGINYETYAKVSTLQVKTATVKSKPVAKNADAKKELLEKDVALQASLKHEGVNAYQSVLSTDIKFFRQNHPPFATIDAEKIGPAGNIKQHAGDVSAAGDLGYTYGLLYPDARPGTNASARTFLRIWKKEDGKTWTLVFDAVF